MRIVAKLLLALVLMGGMIALFVMLANTSSGGAKSIERFADPIRAGGSVSAEVGGAEADALTQVLRTSKRVSVSNFQAQSDTACFWVELDGVDAAFEMRESGDDWQVMHASFRRECECPDPADEPCQLK